MRHIDNPKIKKTTKPLRTQRLTHVHKALLFCVINLVELIDFEPLWQKIDFSEWTQNCNPKNLNPNPSQNYFPPKEILLNCSMCCKSV